MDVAAYFSNPEIKIDFFSSVVYGVLFSGWVFALGFLIVSAVIPRAKLLFTSAALVTISSIIWSIMVPHLSVQMIFLSLTNNQQIGSTQAMGSGEITAMISGFVMTYCYIKFKLQ